jgi:hypothetical protein
VTKYDKEEGIRAYTFQVLLDIEARKLHVEVRPMWVDYGKTQ